MRTTSLISVVITLLAAVGLALVLSLPAAAQTSGTSTPTPDTEQLGDNAIPQLLLPPPVEQGRMAFVSDWGGYSEIYVMNADGAGAARLTNNISDEWATDWSHDGQRIAFASMLTPKMKCPKSCCCSA